MGLFDRFRRKPPARLLPDHLADSPIWWRVGDPAVCISSGEWEDLARDKLTVAGPQYGDQHAVVRVVMVESRQFLSFTAFADQFYAACYFERPRAVGEERGMKVLRGLLKAKPAKPRVGEPVLIGRES